MNHKKLSPLLFSVMVIYIIIVDWIACDVLFPAEPEMIKALDTDASTLNLTVVLFFISEAVAMLFGGPISDRYGRKPVLAIGTIAFTVFAGLAMLAPDIGILIIARVLCALGAGVMTAVAYAMIPDYLTGKLYEKVMSLSQSMVLLGSVVAPFLGSFLMIIGNWRTCLGSLFVMGIIAVVCVLVLPETLDEENRVKGGMSGALKGTIHVMKDRTSAAIILMVSCLAVPYWAIFGVSSYIIMDDFGLSYMAYSLFYGGISLVSFTAPFVYLWMDNRLQNSKTELSVCLFLLLLSVILLFFFGKISAILLFIAMIPFTYCEGMARPLGMVKLLAMHEDTAGAASGVSLFFLQVIGSLGTVFSTFAWSDYIDGITIITFVTFVVVSGIFLLFARKSF